MFKIIMERSNMLFDVRFQSKNKVSLITIVFLKENPSCICLSFIISKYNYRQISKEKFHHYNCRQCDNPVSQLWTWKHIRWYTWISITSKKHYGHMKYDVWGQIPKLTLKFTDHRNVKKINYFKMPLTWNYMWWYTLDLNHIKNYDATGILRGLDFPGKE